MAMLEWTVEEEVHLFTALSGLRPVGLNKHFYMACIINLIVAERLSKSLKRDIDPETIWEHLRTMYNLDALDEAEPLPFSNEEREFYLPESEFGPQMSKKRAESESKTQQEESANAASAVTTTSAVTTAETKSSATPQPKERRDVSRSVEQPKRAQKRTRGSTSLESNSPSTTPPPTSNKRRRI